MSQDVFDLIVASFSFSPKEISAIDNFLSSQEVGDKFDCDRFVDFTDLAPIQGKNLLEYLVEKNQFGKSIFGVCPECETELEITGDTQEIYCDICYKDFLVSKIETKIMYSLNRIYITQTIVNKETAKLENPISNLNNQRRVQIAPWKTLQEADYTLIITKLDAGAKEKALQLLQKLGLVRIRFQGDAPSPERLESLEGWVGPARQVQNDFSGKVKSLIPNWSAPPNTGDSAHALPHHVDGTQDAVTPAILAFQYDLTGAWGGESTFMDMSSLFSELEYSELERILTSLATKCGTCTKTKGEWSKTFTGPLIRAENGGHCISVRLREDDHLKVDPERQPHFDRLKYLVKEWGKVNITRYTPHEGDIVIFDNWRVLHGRERIGGNPRHQRIHDRIWIDNLARDYDGIYQIGIRPLNPGLMDAIIRSNQ